MEIEMRDEFIDSQMMKEMLKEMKESSEGDGGGSGSTSIGTLHLKLESAIACGEIFRLRNLFVDCGVDMTVDISTVPPTVVQVVSDCNERQTTA